MRSTNDALVQITKRAETNESDYLRSTFVDSGVASVLKTRDHQAVFGRRGTGKTHAFVHLAQELGREGVFVAYVDLRTVGSGQGLFDTSVAHPSELAARLLIDVVKQVADTVLSVAAEGGQTSTGFVDAINELQEAISAVRIDGEVTQRVRRSRFEKRNWIQRVFLKLGGGDPSLGLGVEDSGQEGVSTVDESTVVGVERKALNFSDVSASVRRFVDSLEARQLWILLDEWGSVPSAIQPYLAGYIKRALLPVTGVVVKFATVEVDANFRSSEGGALVGLELGADITGNLNMDDFMVFESDQSKAVEFFSNLFNGHADSLALPEEKRTWKRGGFVRDAFMDTRAFQELVRAAEGVPRDAINVASKAAQAAGDGKIGVDHVRRAARDWYQQEKLKAVETLPGISELLRWIIDEVIGVRRTKAFLLRQDQDSNPIIRRLFDARLIHLVRRGYSAQDRPGERYNVYMLDYGAYVDLIRTKNQPSSALMDDSGAGIEIPDLDLRSARRAILDLDDAPESAKV